MNIIYVKKRRKATIGPISNGLVIHLDASDSNSYSGSGTTWADLSGYSNDFTAQSSTNVTYNSTYKYFTLNKTSGSYFLGPAGNASSLSSVDTYFTFFLICKPTTTNQQPFTFNWNGNNQRNISCHIAWNFNGNNVFFDVNGCCLTNQRINYGQGFTDSGVLQVSPEPNVTTQISSPAVWGFRSKSTEARRSIWYNGTEIINSGTNSTNTGWQNYSTPLALGTVASALGTYAWAARIWGFLFYNRGLTDTEMSDMQDYFDVHYDGLLI